MMGSKLHWLHKSPQAVAAENLFKTLVRLKIVDPIYDPHEWITWYARMRTFASKYE